MLSNLEIFFGRLRDAQYAHLLLEPLMLYGLLFGIIFFAIGHYLGQAKCRAAALIVITVCSLIVSPYLGLRNKAIHPRELDRRPADAKLIKEQYQRRVDTKWVYYAFAVLAVLALLGGGKLAQISNIAIIGGGIGIVLLSAWLHMKEAEIYHPNIIQRAVPLK